MVNNLGLRERARERSIRKRTRKQPTRTHAWASGGCDAYIFIGTYGSQWGTRARVCAKPVIDIFPKPTIISSWETIYTPRGREDPDR